MLFGLFFYLSDKAFEYALEIGVVPEATQNDSQMRGGYGEREF